MNYRIYRNLTKGNWSVQHRTPNGWRVAFHLDQIIARNCRFTVSQAGRQRVRREGRKGVHAFIECEKLINANGVTFTHGDTEARVTYNPYDDVPGFHRKFYFPNKEVVTAGEVELRTDGSVYGYMFGFNSTLDIAV